MSAEKSGSREPPNGPNLPMAEERGQAKSEAVFLAARYLYFQLIAAWGFRDPPTAYGVTLAEFRLLADGGGLNVQLNVQYTPGGPFIHCLVFNNRIFMVATEGTIAL